MKYITICKALYDYEPQSDEELTFKEDDILYILENDDPDWWKAQLKTATLDQIGSIGLIPSNYIDEAEPIGTVKAMFDYQAQQEEELTFHEDDIMVLYENDDPDWFLVKSREGQIGLAPSNYIETISAEQETKANNTTHSYDERTPTVSVFSALSNKSDVQHSLNTNDEAVSWSVHEYDVDKKKKKKNKGNLLIGNGMFCYGSETDKTSPVRQFSILDITDYTQDGKNVHVELCDSSNSIFDFQASSKSEAKSILAKLDDSRSIANRSQASSSSSSIPIPAPSPIPAIVEPTVKPEPEPELEPEQPVCEPRWAIVLYDFDAQGEEELTVKEQEQVLIVDYVSSNEWWTVEHQDGRIGIVPTTYVKFQEDYEADLAKEENESRRQQELVEQQQQREREAEAARQRRLEEDAQREKERLEKEQLLQQQKQQQEQLEKERARQAEAERRRKMQEEAKQRELDAKRAAARAAAAANSPQITAASSPRRSQIPAPLPPTAKLPVAKTLPTEQAVNSISVPANRSLPDRPKQAHDTGKPDPSKVRTWTDRTGAFKVEAQFLACNNGKIRLHKINGVKIDVPVQKMCTEDLHYIEQETGARLLEDKSDNIPLAHLTSNKTDNDNGFNWFDYFTKINIPSKSALRYAATFQQDGLGEKDIDNLTHRKMKLLGMTEKHVQRLQRYLETQVAEPPSDDEQGGINVSKKGKKTVTFGSTSFIQDDDDDVDETDPEIQRQRQIEEDERFARQLQLQENDTTRTHLHRRGTGRPTPSTSAPKDMNAQIMDKIKNQLRTEPLIPSPVSPSTQNTSAATVSVPITTSSTGFQDDAWANRPSAPTTTNTTVPTQVSGSWTSRTNSNSTPVMTTPPRSSAQTIQPTVVQSPASLSQQQLQQQQLQQQQLQQQQLQQQQLQQQQLQQQQLQQQQLQQQQLQQQQLQQQQLQQQQQSIQYTPQQNQPTVPLPPRQRPTPQLSQTNQVDPNLLSQWTSNNPTPSPQQQRPVPQPIQQQQSFTQIQPTTNVVHVQPALPHRSPGTFNQQQQQSQQFNPQPLYGQNQPQQQQQQPFLSSNVQPQMAMNVPVSSVLPPPLVPTSSPMSTLKPQPTGRNWTSSTPDNPFGNGPSQQQSPQHSAMGVGQLPHQGSSGSFNQSLQPAQVFASMTGNQNMTPQQQTNANDPYAVFKNMNPQGPSVFNPQQPQQTGFVQQQSFYNGGWQ